MTSPTQRTLKYLRDQGMTVDMCERWIRNPKHPAGGFRKDMFSFADMVAVGDGITAVQSCGQAFSAHLKGMLDNENVLAWLRAGGDVSLIGWRKLKIKRGGKATRWAPRIANFYISNNGIDYTEAK